MKWTAIFLLVSAHAGADQVDEVIAEAKSKQDLKGQAIILGKCLASREMLLGMMKRFGTDSKIVKQQIVNNEASVESIKSTISMLAMLADEKYSYGWIVKSVAEEATNTSLGSINSKLKLVSLQKVSAEEKNNQFMSAILMYDDNCKRSEYLQTHMDGGLVGYYTSKL